MADIKDIMKQLDDMSGLKDSTGNYNRLKPTVEISDEEYAKQNEFSGRSSSGGNGGDAPFAGRQRSAGGGILGSRLSNLETPDQIQAKANAARLEAIAKATQAKQEQASEWAKQANPAQAAASAQPVQEASNLRATLKGSGDNVVGTRDPEGFEINRNEDGTIIPENIDEILARAYRGGASDIHITVGTPPKMRLHGELLPMPYSELTPSMTKKLLSKILTEDTQSLFEREGDLDFAYPLPGVCRFRVNLFKQRGTWSAVFRSLSTDIPPAEKLGIPQSVLDMASRKRGMVLVTGPTGSGKSTTLAAIIDIINRTRREHIITLEDPIEYIHKHKMSNVNQREVGTDTKSFAAAVRAALREDPDVILIGEMRDPETISTAITAAETGHLVFSTLHTIGAAATVDRIVDSFSADQQSQVRAQLASVLECVCSQQLLPVATGKGRVAAFEVMIGNIAIKSLIRENKITQITSQIQTCAQDGMMLMDDSLMKLYKEGRITKDKTIEFAVDKALMLKTLD